MGSRPIRVVPELPLGKEFAKKAGYAAGCLARL